MDYSGYKSQSQKKQTKNLDLKRNDQYQKFNFCKNQNNNSKTQYFLTKKRL